MNPEYVASRKDSEDLLHELERVRNMIFEYKDQIRSAEKRNATSDLKQDEVVAERRRRLVGIQGRICSFRRASATQLRGLSLPLQALELRHAAEASELQCSLQVCEERRSSSEMEAQTTLAKQADLKCHIHDVQEELKISKQEFASSAVERRDASLKPYVMIQELKERERCRQQRHFEEYAMLHCCLQNCDAELQNFSTAPLEEPLSFSQPKLPQMRRSLDETEAALTRKEALRLEKEVELKESQQKKQAKFAEERAAVEQMEEGWAAQEQKWTTTKGDLQHRLVEAHREEAALKQREREGQSYWGMVEQQREALATEELLCCEAATKQKMSEDCWIHSKSVCGGLVTEVVQLQEEMKKQQTILDEQWKHCSIENSLRQEQIERMEDILRNVQSEVQARRDLLTFIQEKRERV